MAVRGGGGFVRAWVIVASALALAGCGKSVPDVIRIGVAQPLSGPSAARGQDLLNGALLAVNEINAQGLKIGGKPVKLEIVSRDDKADAETAKKVAQELVEAKVTAVIGHLSSDITEVTLPIYRQGNVLQLFTSSASHLARIGEGNVFRLVANDTLQAQAMVGYLGDVVRANNVGVVYEQTAFGKPMNEDISKFLAAQQRKLAFSVGVDNKTTDFSQAVAKLKAEPADALIAVLRDNQLIPLLEQLSAAGLQDLVVLGPNAAKTAKLARAAVPTKRLFVTSQAFGADEFVGGPQFLAKFREAYKSEPVWAAHYAYDAVHVLADTFKRAETVDPKVLREKLRTIDPHAPVTSSMRFDENGEQRYGAISVYRRDKGEWDSVMRSDKW
jgi:branched-chain amino acid transport system substrate-binding protein